MVPRLHPKIIMLKQTDVLPKDQHLQRAFKLFQATQAQQQQQQQASQPNLDLSSSDLNSLPNSSSLPQPINNFSSAHENLVATENATSKTSSNLPSTSDIYTDIKTEPQI